MKRRKMVTVILMLLCSTLLISSCGQVNKANTGTSTGTSSKASVGLITIKLLASTGGSGKSITGAVDSFNKANDGKIKLSVDLIAQESLQEKEILQFVSGSATYDVLATLWSPSCRPYFLPLDSYLKRDGVNVNNLYGAGVMKAAQEGGTYRDLPFRSQCFPVFYRTDLFKAASLKPPTNMQEYLDDARKLTVKNANGSIVRYGTSLQMQSPYWTVQTFSTFFMPLGGYFLTEDLKHASPTLKSQLAYNVMKFLKTIQDEKLCPNPLSFTYDDNVVGMQTDQIAFSIESSARASMMDDPAKSKVVGKFDYAAMATQKVGTQPPSNFCSIWFLGIDKNSTHKDAAWEFVKWATDKDQQDYMAQQFANGPSILSIYNDVAYQQVNKSAVATKELLDVMPRDFLPVSNASELQQVIHDQMQLYMLGKQDEATTGKNMFDKIEALVTKK